MTQMQQSAAGNRLNFGLFLDTDGLPIGKTHIRPTAGFSTNGGPIRFRMPKSVTPTSSPTPSPTLATGEDGIDQHRYIFPADNTQVTALSLSAEDLTVVGLIQNMPVNQFAGGQYVGLGENIHPFDMSLIFNSQSIRVSDGAGLWKALIYPRATMTYAGGDGFNERGVRLFRFDFTAQPVSYEIWGVTVLNADGSQAAEDRLTWENLAHPLTMQAFTGDGAEDTFDLDYRPIDVNSIDVALCSPTTGIRAATIATVSSVQTTSPYNFALSAAPSPTGTRGTAVYQFSP